MPDMSSSEQLKTSPIEELEKRLGVQWQNLAKARALAQKTKSSLQREFAKEENDDDISIVVLGSLARDEFTRNSDFDWSVLVDGLANPSHVEVEHRVGRTLDKRKYIKPGPEGIFGNLSFSHNLINLIGGEDDTNRNTTQRILMLLESSPIGRRSAYDRVIRNILRRYLEEDGTFSRANTRYLVPRFLLNDIVRYWRTITVDFAYKRKSRAGKGAALRNIKLRMSRKLILAAGLLTCFRCELAIGKPERCEPPRQSFECVQCLETFLSNTPLEILALTFLSSRRFDNTAKSVFDAYDGFIGLLNDKKRRKHISDLDQELTWNDECYQMEHKRTRELHDGLIALFFDDKKMTNSKWSLGKLSRHYGIF